MTRGTDRARRRFAALLLAATLGGCATSSPQGTHEGKLLDNKVSAERVQAALRKAGPEYRHVEVAGSREGITLTGRVPSAETRSRAEGIARNVDPHVNVSDRLGIR